MEYNYKAFISYRHAKLDMKVAAEIQNRLERYTIPGSIRKEYGLKKIGSIFRDKDELPSTNDLTDYIKNVLTSSEYLICICSPQYLKSVWCRRELEFFLQTHDKAHVLTVLAEGDPHEVIPETLCTETVTSTDENGNTVTTQNELEPLSCDWRIEHYRAVTEELPRLVSALIGCRYAELRRKERKRRLRITAAAAAGGIALMAYFIWSYMGIRSNYQKALINQSRSLAGAAQDALDNNDNLLAAQLSLAALPDEHKDRPILPKALYTLSKAVGAYEGKDRMNFRGIENFTMTRGSLDQFLVSPDAAYLAMTSDRSALAVWDLQADRKVAEIDTRDLTGSPANSLMGHGKEQFVLWDYYGNNVALIRYSDASVIWHRSFEDPVRKVISPADDARAPLVLFTYRELAAVDAQSGKTLSSISAEEASGGSTSDFFDSWGGSAVCPGAGCVIAAAGKDREDGRTEITGIVTYFYNTGKTVWTPFHTDLASLDGMSRDESGRILLTYAEKEEDAGYSRRYVLSYNAFGTDYDEGKETVLLIEEGSGKTLWKNVLHYQGSRKSVKSYRRTEYAPYTYQDLRVIGGGSNHTDRELAVAATANVAALYDINTGDPVKTVTLADQIVSVEEESPGDTCIRVNGSSGTHYYFDWYEKPYHSMNFMSGGMEDSIFFGDSAAASGENEFVVIQDGSARLLQGGNGDEDWSPFDCRNPDNYWIDYAMSGTTLILLDESMQLYGYDLATGTDLWQSKINGVNGGSFLGRTSDGAYLFLMTNDYPNRFFKVSVKDGGTEAVSLTESGESSDGGEISDAELWTDALEHPIVSGSYIFYEVSDHYTDSALWNRYSMDDGSITHIKMPDSYDRWSDDSQAFFDADGQKGVILKNDIGYKIDFEKGTVSLFSASFPISDRGAYQDGNGRFAIWNSAEKTVYVYEADGTTAWTTTDIPGQVSEMLFEGGDLYVTTENERLYRYKADNGYFYGMLEMNFIADGNIEIIKTSGGQAVISSGYGELMTVDLANWEVTAQAKDIIAYSEATRQIICASDVNGDGKPELGACPYYSPRELIEKGKRFVGDRVMSDENKSLYGLE